MAVIPLCYFRSTSVVNVRYLCHLRGGLLSVEDLHDRGSCLDDLGRFMGKGWEADKDQSIRWLRRNLVGRYRRTCVVTLVLSCSTFLAAVFVFVRQYQAGRGLAANNILAFHSSAEFIGGFNAFRRVYRLISRLPFKHILFSMNNSVACRRTSLSFSLANPPAPFRLLPINLSDWFFLSEPVYLFNLVARISDCLECVLAAPSMGFFFPPTRYKSG